ncbi:ATPase [Erythrobacter sp. SDW2]|uniref:ATPase n=1 Tax=Erythrobacter sp. SDW2 TaxID=2907154 RepID=UPI001F1AD227|nr:ATPase [Erythrobacter sp. SDW2]UIP05698.1 ATPase [Erythrobacter sp. SDW2]
MSGGHHIRAVGASGGDGTAQTPAENGAVAAAEDDLVLEDSWEDEWAEEPARRTFGWLVPAAALLAIAAWTVFFAWANRAALLAGTTPQQWTGWIGQWAIPVLVVLALWVLFQRNSTLAARRYAEAASALSSESALLEQRLTTVNRELSLAREFLASQGLELESLGRIASERLSEHADRLQLLVRNNSAQVEQIASVSAIAMENMDKLRGDLPVIANSARDVANQIGNAGGTAEGQIERLVSGFARLNEFGAASERQVAALSEKVEATLAAFEAQAVKMEEITSARFAALREASEEFRGELDSREVHSLAALRRRANQLAEELGSTRGMLEEQEEEALKSMRARLTGLRNESETIARAIRQGEEEAKALWIGQIDGMQQRLTEAVEQIRSIDDQFLAAAGKKQQELRDEAARIDANIAERNAIFAGQLDERRAQLEASEAAALTALQEQLAAIDSELEARRARQAEHALALQTSTEAATAKVAELTAQIEGLLGESRTAQEGLLETTLAMAKDLASSRADMAATQSVVADMTEACVRLLELIQASVQHSRNDLPNAIGVAEQRLEAARQSTETLGAMLSESVARSVSISNYVIAANDSGESLQIRTGALHARLKALSADYSAEITSLREALGMLEEDGQRISESSQEQLREAITLLEDKVREALALAGEESSETIEKIAQGIGSRAAETIDRAVRQNSDQAIAALDEAATRSAASAREAAVQLRDQLSLVNELAGNLENRVERARERAQEQVDNDFARRVALITEALNSNAIDIAKSLSTDVTDTAWASYLRGDRGIFTRRAVSLLSNTEAREIAELYDADVDFRDHVSRYIHDFEAMLRTMLSTRDGNAIGVTLLSSDMGKLYVALAQAIERLRTE